jgi:hypothetical protein
MHSNDADRDDVKEAIGDFLETTLANFDMIGRPDKLN